MTLLKPWIAFNGKSKYFGELSSLMRCLATAKNPLDQPCSNLVKVKSNQINIIKNKKGKKLNQFEGRFEKLPKKSNPIECKFEELQKNGIESDENLKCYRKQIRIVLDWPCKRRL